MRVPTNAQTVEVMRHLTVVARALKTDRKSLQVKAADRTQREALAKALTELNFYHPILVETTREVGQTRDLITKALRGRRFWFRA